MCIDGGKNPSWNEVFTFNACSDSTLRVEVWDEDSVKDDLVGAGTYNLMNVYNMNGMRSDNGMHLIIKNTSICTTTDEEQEGFFSLSSCKE